MKIIEGVRICLETTYFSNNRRFYRQLHGCSMGSPLANLVMEHFEIHALETYQGTPPRIWLRYVDDTFVVIKQQEHDSFFRHTNIISNHIKFTQEKCSNNNLAFLDCNIEVTNGNILTTTVYRKPTHTDHWVTSSACS